MLAEGHIARGYAGCFDVTPDWHPVMDQVGPEGSYVAAGFSGHGFKLSPAVGRMMAALITEGPSGDPTCRPSASRASPRASRSAAPTATG